MTKAAERRKYPRKKLAIPSTISGDDASTECTTLDLSPNGLSCITDRPLTLFTKVRVTLMMPERKQPGSDGSVVCEGVVVRCDADQSGAMGRYHTAIYFDSIDDDAMEVIRRHVVTNKH